MTRSQQIKKQVEEILVKHKGNPVLCAKKIDAIYKKLFHEWLEKYQSTITQIKKENDN